MFLSTGLGEANDTGRDFPPMPATSIIFTGFRMRNLYKHSPCVKKIRRQKFSSLELHLNESGTVTLWKPKRHINRNLPKWLGGALYGQKRNHSKFARWYMF